MQHTACLVTIQVTYLLDFCLCFEKDSTIMLQAFNTHSVSQLCWSYNTCHSLDAHMPHECGGQGFIYKGVGICPLMFSPSIKYGLQQLQFPPPKSLSWVMPPLAMFLNESLVEYWKCSYIIINFNSKISSTFLLHIEQFCKQCIFSSVECTMLKTLVQV